MSRGLTNDFALRVASSALALLSAGCAQLPTASIAPNGETQAAVAGTVRPAAGLETGSIEGTARPQVKAVRELIARGDRPAAKQAINRIVADSGSIDKADALDLGRLALDLGDAPLAGDVLALADQSDWRVLTARGAAMAQQGLYQDALPLFERAYRAAPTNASVLSNIAMAKVAAGQPEQAEPLLRKAAGLRPSDQQIRDNLALVLVVLGREGEAKAVAGHLFSDKAPG